MWCVILTQTGIMCEGRNPAHVEVETYDKEYEASKAFRRMFSDKVGVLGCELEYAEFDNSPNEWNARLFGEFAVVVIAVKKLPEPCKKKAEVA